VGFPSTSNPFASSGELQKKKKKKEKKKRKYQEGKKSKTRRKGLNLAHKALLVVRLAKGGGHVLWEHRQKTARALGTGGCKVLLAARHSLHLVHFFRIVVFHIAAALVAIIAVWMPGAVQALD